MFKHRSAADLLTEFGDYAKLKTAPKRGSKIVSHTEISDIGSKTSLSVNETFKFLKTSRVEKIGRLSIAEWLPEQRKAIVTHRVSKIWSTIGSSEGNKQYIDEFEILFLLESNQLELGYKNVNMSLEQVRSLLCKKFQHFTERYRVYAQLRRSGCIVFKHDAKKNINQKEISNKNVSRTGDHMVNEIKNSASCSNLTQSTSMSTNNNQSSMKRQHSDLQDKESDSKRPKFTDQGPLLQNNCKYKSFAQIFKNVQIFDNQNEICKNHEVNIHLDLYKANQKFRKSSPNSPACRIIILRILLESSLVNLYLRSDLIDFIGTEQSLSCERCLIRKKNLFMDDVPIIVARVGVDNISYYSLTDVKK